MTKRSLDQRLTRRLLAVIVPVLAAVIAGVAWDAGREVVSGADARAGLAAARAGERILETLQTVAEIPKTLAAVVAERPPDGQRLRSILTSSLQVNANVYGMALAAEPGGLYPDPYCLYAFRQGNGIRFRRLDTPAYRYLEQPWYRKPKKLGRAVWSEPYFDAGGGEALMSTYSVPVVSREGRFLGVATADVTLGRLRSIVREVAASLGGGIVLFSSRGAVIAAAGGVQGEEIRRLAAASGTHPPGSAWVTYPGRAEDAGWWARLWASTGGADAKRVLFKPVGRIGWTLAVLLPLDRLYRPVYRLAAFLLVAGGGGIALALFAVRTVSRHATADVARLAALAGEIADGHLETPVPEQATTTETERLSRAFRSMQTALQRHIRELVDQTERRGRMENELRIARDIQMQMLPRAFPTLGDRLEVCAVIEPALEVGGDFYDGFPVDGGRRFCFVVGDVAGKGVPAALFMAVTRTLIKSTAALGLTPGAVLEQVNHALQEGNDQAMFVTVFLGILDPAGGELAFANAGHPPPLLSRGKSWLTAGDPLPPLGAWPGIEYPTWTRRLNGGETVLVYTDGISEAMNGEGELFGMERMKQAAEEGISAREIVARMRAAVDRFAAGAPQADDITLLATRWQGQE